jgi:hypothetical protein
VTPLDTAARAAYTRPGEESTLPFERRSPRRRAYWKQVATRALAAVVTRQFLAAVLDEHAYAGAACRRCGTSEPAAEHHAAAIVAAVFGDELATVDRQEGRSP